MTLIPVDVAIAVVVMVVLVARWRGDSALIDGRGLHGNSRNRNTDLRSILKVKANKLIPRRVS